MYPKASSRDKLLTSIHSGLCISADILAPTINLFVVQQLPQQDQSLGGALIQTSNQLGRSLGLAISTAVETAIVNADITTQDPGSARLLQGLRAAEWVNVALAGTSLLIILALFRDMTQVGAAIKKPTKT